MTALVSQLFIDKIPIDSKITNFIKIPHSSQFLGLSLSMKII